MSGLYDNPIKIAFVTASADDKLSVQSLPKSNVLTETEWEDLQAQVGAEHYMEAELFPHLAPDTVKNFVSLIKSSFYDGLIFHRVIENFMIQGGCPDGNGMGGPGYTIKGEFKQNGFVNPLLHDRGVLSMARAMHPDSAGSQFFIMHQAAPHLDGQYAAFGRLLNGEAVLDKIAGTAVDYNDRPLTEQQIVHVYVIGSAELGEPAKLTK